MLKKLLLCAGAAAVVVVGIRLQERASAIRAEQEAQKAAEAAAAQAAKAPPPVDPNAEDDHSGPPADPAEVALKVEQEKAKLLADRLKETGDPMKLRQTNAAMPRSRTDLMTHLTDFKEPMLPKLANTPDSDVKTIYRGFYEAEPGKYRRIEFNRAQTFNLSIEGVDNRFPTYLEAKDEFMLNNYNDDPYSVVMTLRDMRVIYLKFRPAAKIPDYNDPDFRVMTGWVVHNRVGRKVALIDSRKPELADPRAPGQYGWPRLGTIQQLMPTSELAD